jgi:hypothetical protein
MAVSNMSKRSEGYRARAAYVRSTYANCGPLEQFAANIAFSFEKLAETVEFWENEEQAVARMPRYCVLRRS